MRTDLPPHQTASIPQPPRSALALDEGWAQIRRMTSERPRVNPLDVVDPQRLREAALAMPKSTIFTSPAKLISTF